MADGARRITGRWRPHDLRRTTRTEPSARKVGPDIAPSVTGHGMCACHGSWQGMTLISKGQGDTPAPSSHLPASAIAMTSSCK
ncbi:hypothetical protein DOO74_06995 [Rhodobacteraceae bacterium AsT-22]|nr:hypothetical protein DOO74_06995 [Rhodobacteraceae bacterium AsT-22]